MHIALQKVTLPHQGDPNSAWLNWHHSNSISITSYGHYKKQHSIRKHLDKGLCHRLCLCQHFGEWLRHRLCLCHHFGMGLCRPLWLHWLHPSQYFGSRALTANLSVINSTYANNSVRGFTIDFGIIDCICHHLVWGFTIHFGIIDFTYANFLARGFAANFDVIDFAHSNLSVESLHHQNRDL